MILNACGATDIGRKRSRNEDSFVVRPDLGLFAVADGMGGHAAGDVASLTAIDTLTLAFPSQPLAQAMLAANLAVWERSHDEPEKSGMGTTLTVLALDPENDAEFICGHVGDSRLYRLRGGALDQLTRDHSIAGTSMLTRALGTRKDVEIDAFRASILAGDRFLICSDGLTGMVHDEDLRAMLQQDKPLDAVCGDLIEAANLHGGLDNITAIVIGMGPTPSL